MRAPAMLLVAVALSLGCTPARSADPPPPPIPAGAARYHETTNPTIEGFHVGIGNIWARDLPGPNGEPNQPRPSAMLSIYDPKLDKVVARPIVVVGSVIPIGAAKYQVLEIFVGKASPGWLTVQKLP